MIVIVFCWIEEGVRTGCVRDRRSGVRRGMWRDDYHFMTTLINVLFTISFSFRFRRVVRCSRSRRRRREGRREHEKEGERRG